MFGDGISVTIFHLCSGIDNSRHGHIIGAAQVRVPAPERQMTAASMSVVRLLLHMSMFLGATESPQVVISFSRMKLEIVCVRAHVHLCGWVCVYHHEATVGVMLCSWEGNSVLWKSWSAVCNAETSAHCR